VAHKPEPSGKNETGEYAKFTNFMKQLVTVPHSDIKAVLDQEKLERKRKAEKISGPASGE
jgi:hypothetical protein